MFVSGFWIFDALYRNMAYSINPNKYLMNIYSLTNCVGYQATVIETNSGKSRHTWESPVELLEAD